VTSTRKGSSARSAVPTRFPKRMIQGIGANGRRITRFSLRVFNFSTAIALAPWAETNS